MGRPGDPRGDRALRARGCARTRRGARGTSIHPPHERTRLGERRVRHRVRADYLVLGLGDVYLGAPVATPLDPRHRLVTTKYTRPAPGRRRTRWASAVRTCASTDGGAGRLPVRRPHHAGVEPPAPAVVGSVRGGTPWLLRFFDRISWYPVEPDELLDLRADLAAGRGAGGDRDRRRSVLVGRARAVLTDNADRSRRSGRARRSRSPTSDAGGPMPASSPRLRARSHFPRSGTAICPLG